MPVYPYQCSSCGHQEDFLVAIKNYTDTLQCSQCPGTMKRIFTPVAIVGLLWDWKKGYRSGVDDPVSEIKFDMMKLEQSMTEEGNLKKYHKKKRALENFAEAHSEVLDK